MTIQLNLKYYDELRRVWKIIQVEPFIVGVCADTHRVSTFDAKGASTGRYVWATSLRVPTEGNGEAYTDWCVLNGLEVPAPPPWPQDGATVYVLDEDSPIYPLCYEEEWHKTILTRGNLFPSREAAKRERDRRRLMASMRRAAEAAGPTLKYGWAITDHATVMQCQIAAFGSVMFPSYELALDWLDADNHRAELERLA
jgi:hypothetical protein